MKKGLAAGFILLIPAVALAALLKGPYIQNVQKHQMTISWETDEPAPATLYWGDSPDSLDFEASSLPNEFSYNGGVLYNHWVILAGLERGTTYFYRIEGPDYASEVYSFRTAPKNTEPFMFVVYGDSRGGSIVNPNEAHESIAAAILSELPDFYINTGDLVSDGESLDDWDYFFYVERELMARAALYPVFGNHEDGEDVNTGISGDMNFTRLFAYPAPRDGATWYSFDYANVHFLIIDIEKILSLVLPEAEQRAWLEADLEEAVQNPYTNFIFVSFHEPGFSWKEGRSGNFIARYMLTPTFQAHGVKLIFNGHDHFYAHAFLNDMDQIVTGGGGASLYDFKPNVESRAGYRAHEKVNHYCVVEVDGQTARVTVKRADGSVIESFSVHSPNPPQPEPDDDDDTSDDDVSDDDVSDDDSGNGADEGGDEAGCGC